MIYLMGAHSEIYDLENKENNHYYYISVFTYQKSVNGGVNLDLLESQSFIVFVIESLPMKRLG